ncbi:MAG: hypothetical protein JST86_10780 [Bacteroidetes bacterium]|nr:hypothetical protein [Bacteroidota bacterium]
MKRNTFIKLSAMAALAPAANAMANTPLQLWHNSNTDEAFMQSLAAANDAQVDKLLAGTGNGAFMFSRKSGYDLAVLSASYCYALSKYFHSELVLPKLQEIVAGLQQYQTEDGTVNIGNLESPPDTAFLLEPLTAAAFILKKDGNAALESMRQQLQLFIEKSAAALVTGGVHTPNHRWVICAALARVNALAPSQKYLSRIEDWLGEGIFMDKDGHYPERSRLYGGVENNSLLTMARLLRKPQLLQYVKRNLESTYYYLEPNGDLVTTDSRRQDQYIGKTIVSYYNYYRWMANHFNDAFFAAIAKAIEQMKGFKEEVLDRSLCFYLENETLQQRMPAPATLPVEYNKWFTTSHLLRLRNHNTTATLFGGVDWPLIIASGRSVSPDFFAFRKGNAILRFMRLSCGFFATGYFYSKGLTQKDKRYILHKKLTVPYYQPLPKSKRKVDGDYALSPSIDGRFWNKMDFQDRPVSNVKTLDTTIAFTVQDGQYQIELDITGTKGVAVTIELCFAEGGTVTGITADDNRNQFLENGYGTFTSGEDSIRFGPGAVTHKNITNLEGERYSTHFGTLHTKGNYVYITGTTPFHHQLNFS